MAKIPSNRTTGSSKKTTYNAIPDDTYMARIVRFIGFGMQEQPVFDEKEVKDPAFKCSIQFELLGTDVTGVDHEGKPIEPRPACQFRDYFLFPGAKRGHVYDLCRVLDPTIDKVPGDLDWFLDKLGSVVNVQVGSYKDKQGNIKNKVVSVSSVPSMFKNQAPAARTDLVGFDPYTESESNMIAYAKLFPFQRTILEEAIDKDNIPYAGKEHMKLEGGADKTKTEDKTTTKVVEQKPNEVDADVPFDDDVPFAPIGLQYNNAFLYAI